MPLWAIGGGPLFKNQSGLFKGRQNQGLNAILMRAQASLDGQRLDAGAQLTKLEWFPDKVVDSLSREGSIDCFFAISASDITLG